MSISTYLSNFAETRERHPNNSLKTHYYKTNYTKIKDQVVLFAEENDYTIRSINDAHGEIYLQQSKHHIMVQVIQVNPIETAVDMKVQTYHLMGRNRPIKVVVKLYEYLNKKLDFKGLSLHP